MLRTTVKVNRTTPRFSDFHYAYHFIEDVFLKYSWLIQDGSFYWPEGHLPDFLCGEGDIPIPTNNGRIQDLTSNGQFGIVSPAFMFTSYKNIWGDWNKIIAIKNEAAATYNMGYIDYLLDRRMDEIDLGRHPVVFSNVDSAFWVVRSQGSEIEKRLIDIYPKVEGIEYDTIDQEYW